MSSSLIPIPASPPLTTYEEYRNNTKKALHDAIQRHLLAVGFKDVAVLRPVFSGEATSVVRNEASPLVQKQVHKKVHNEVRTLEDSVAVRRTRRNTVATAARLLSGSASPCLLQHSTCSEVAEIPKTFPCGSCLKSYLPHTWMLQFLLSCNYFNANFPPPLSFPLKLRCCRSFART